MPKLNIGTFTPSHSNTPIYSVWNDTGVLFTSEHAALAQAYYQQHSNSQRLPTIVTFGDLPPKDINTGFYDYHFVMDLTVLCAFPYGVFACVTKPQAEQHATQLKQLYPNREFKVYRGGFSGSFDDDSEVAV